MRGLCLTHGQASPHKTAMNDTSVAADYRATVFLPTTDFPMRGDLPAREPAMLARWQAMGLWEKPLGARRCHVNMRDGVHGSAGSY